MRKMHRRLALFVQKKTQAGAPDQAQTMGDWHSRTTGEKQSAAGYVATEAPKRRG